MPPVALDGSSYYLASRFDLTRINWAGLSDYHSTPRRGIAAASYHFSVPAQQVFAYCGLTDLIYLIFSTIPIKTLYTVRREFPVYKYICTNLGLHYVELGEPEQDVGSILTNFAPAKSGDAAFIFSRPNTLFGSSAEIGAIRDAADRNPQVLFIIDEAYQAFSHYPSAVPLIREFTNIVCLKTASKEFSLPAIRLAWLISGNRDIHSALNTRTYNTVSALSEILVHDIVTIQKQAHSENILHVINECRRVECAIAHGKTLIGRQSHNGMITIQTDVLAYNELKRRCNSEGVEPLFMNDIEVCKRFALPSTEDRFVRFNIWDAATNDKIISIASEL